MSRQWWQDEEYAPAPVQKTMCPLPDRPGEGRVCAGTYDDDPRLKAGNAFIETMRRQRENREAMRRGFGVNKVSEEKSGLEQKISVDDPSSEQSV